MSAMPDLLESETRYPGLPAAVVQRQREYLERRNDAIDSAMRTIRSASSDETRRAAIAAVYSLGYFEGIADGAL